jgi:RNA polymerase sigma factor (sigma-70 family)
MAYTDDEMLAAIRGNDPVSHNKALKQLYLDPVVMAKVTELIASYQKVQLEAPEVIQEGVIILNDLIRNDKFQGKSKVRTFLISICKNIIRSGGKKIEQLSYSTAPTELPEEADLSENPEAHILIEEKSEAESARDQKLQELMSNLTENCKKVIHLYYFLAQSMAQIAEQQGLKNAKQAKKAAGRCREQLRKKILAEPQLANFLKTSL